MGYFDLESIVGCISPITGLTTGYEIQYNEDAIISYHKVDKKIEFVDYYMVSVSFHNFVTLFKFTSKPDRDQFYTDLPAV